MLRSQRLAQQRIIQKIDLANGQIVCGAPIGVDPTQVLLLQDVHFSSLGYGVLNGDAHRPQSPKRDFTWVPYSWARNGSFVSRQQSNNKPTPQVPLYLAVPRPPDGHYRRARQTRSGVINTLS